MSVVLCLAGITIVITAITLSDSEFVKAVKELIYMLVKTTNYTSDTIVQIMHFYV